MPRNCLRPHVRLSLPAVAAVSAALALSAAPAMAADATPAPAPAPSCVDVAGIVHITCPAPAPAPTVPGRPATAKDACPDAKLMPARRNLGRVNRATLCLVNKERSQRGLRKLKAQPSLSHVATAFAHQLVTQHFFDHTAPNGRTMLDRIKGTSYLRGTLRRWSVGENIGYGTEYLATPAAIVKAWMASPGHRANILDSTYREIGLGVSPGTPDGSANGATYVHDFGLRSR